MSTENRDDAPRSWAPFEHEREREEQARLAELEGKLERREINPVEADRELVELALKRFWFLSEAELEDAREFLRHCFNYEPELVETRVLAPGWEEVPDRQDEWMDDEV